LGPGSSKQCYRKSLQRKYTLGNSNSCACKRCADTDRQCFSLPFIKSRVQQKIDRIDQELNGLPVPPKGNAVLIVAECVRKFCDGLKEQIRSEPPQEFRTIWRDKASQFGEHLIGTKPCLTDSETTFSAAVSNSPKMAMHTNTPNSTPRKHRVLPKQQIKQELAAVLIISDSEETKPAEITPQSTPSKKRRRVETAKSLPSRARQGENVLKQSGNDCSRCFQFADDANADLQVPRIISG
jgi:hypothetical protein